MTKHQAIMERMQHTLQVVRRMANCYPPTIPVTHRLWTVKMALRILLLDKGKLIEEGTHEELMALDEPYARMFKLQAEKYETTARGQILANT